MLGKFIHDAYAGEWYNGQWEKTPEYIGNKFSMLIGMPRLRQLRIQEGNSYILYLYFFKGGGGWAGNNSIIFQQDQEND